MATFITVRNQSNDSQRVAARYVNRNLAVHRMIIKRQDCGDKVWGLLPLSENRVWGWTVTHKETGYAAARFDTIAAAVRVAKQADSLGWASTKDEIKANTELCESFKQFVSSEGGILCG
jgi:hypothetical protein